MTPFKKKVLAFALAGTFALSQAGFVSAAVDATETTNINKYDTVRNDMKLIQGDGQQVTLHKPMERYRAFVLYARMLGYASDLEDYVTAFDATDKTVENFTDAAGQSPYVTAAMAYFKENGLSEGGSKGEFNPHASITGQEFYKMMLQALGYKQDTDFTYAEVADKAVELGLITDKAMAGTNKLEEVEIGAALYDTLNTAVKATTEGAAAVTLAYQLALTNPDAVAYLQAFDKVAPTLTVTEPHKIGSRDPGVADGTTATDVTASATVDMADGMPLIGTLSEPGTIHYNFNGQEGSFQTETTPNADGKYAFDTTKLATVPEGSDKGRFPFINTGDNKNVVTMWAEDLAGNATKTLDWKSLIRSTAFVTGGNYVTSGSTLVVSGSSVDLYFTTDMNSVPKVTLLTDKTVKTGTAVVCKEVTAADVTAAKLTTPLTITEGADVHIYKATVNFVSPTSYVRIDATSGKDFGSIVSGNGKVLTFASQSITALNPTFDNGSLGGIKVSFNTAIDPTTVKPANFKVDTKDVDGVIVANDNMSVYVCYKMSQNTEHTITVKGVRTADGQFTMAPASKTMTITDTTAPAVVESLILAPNRIRLYFSEPIYGDDMANPAKYTVNTSDSVAAVDNQHAYIDITAYKTFKTGTNTIDLNFRDGAGYAFSQFTFENPVDVTPPVPTVLKATTNFVTLRFNELINQSTVSISNVPGSVAAYIDSDSRGLPTVTYYFKGANSYLTQTTNGQITFSGVRDLKNNVVPATVLSITAYPDYDVATPTLDAEKQTAASTTASGSRELKVTFDRPVLPLANTTGNFKLYKGTTLIAYTFSPDLSSAFKSADGTVFGYKKYTVTIPAGNNGDYTVNVTNMYDVPSGKTLADFSGTINVANNKLPKVNSVVYDGTGYIYVSYSVPMGPSAIDLNNYIFTTATTTGYGAYFANTSTDTSSLSSDGTVAKLRVTNYDVARPMVTVRGVYSAAGALIDALNVSSNIGAIGSPVQPTLSGASFTVTGSKTLSVALGNNTDGTAGNKIMDNVALSDIKLSVFATDNTTKIDLLAAAYGYFSVDNTGANSVLKYTFTQDIFGKDGTVTLNNVKYTKKLYLESNSVAANIQATSPFGSKLLANSTSSALVVDGVAASLAATQFALPTALSYENTSGDAVFYIAYDESISATAVSIAPYSFVITKNGNKSDIISASEMVIDVSSDAAAFAKLNPTGAYSDYTKLGVFNGVNNVLKVTVNRYKADGVTPNYVIGDDLTLSPGTAILGVNDYDYTNNVVGNAVNSPGAEITIKVALAK